MIQIRPGVKALRHLILWQLGDAEFNLHIAALCNFMCIFKGFSGVWEKGLHLLLGFTVILAARIAHPVFIRYFFAGLDAQQDIVSLFILCKGIMDIIGGDQFNPRVPAQPEKSLIYHLLFWKPMILKLQKEIIFPKYPLIPLCRTHGLLIHSSGQIFLHFSGQTGAEGNDSFVIRFQNLIVYTGLIVKAFHKALGYDLHQVFITLIIFCQKNQMVIPILSSRIFPVKPGSRSHIYLAAQDRFNSHFLCRPVKINHSIHYAMIRDRQAVHSQLLCPGGQLFYLG